MEVSPRSIWETKLIASENSLSVPFTMTIKKNNNNIEEIQGYWEGVTAWSVVVEYEEKPIDDNFFYIA